MYVNMDKHPKNYLQEIFQKLNLPVPKYSSEILNKHEAKPLWRSKVVLYDGSIFHGDICSIKIDSETSAAIKAIISYESKQSQDYRIAVLVDFMSLPNFIDELCDCNNYVSNRTIYIFTDETHPLAYDLPGIITMVSSHPITHINMCLGMMLSLESHDEYIIASANTEYANTLVDMISQPYMGWKSRPARMISNCYEL